MRHTTPAVLLLALGTACASGGSKGGSETTVAPSTASLVNGTSAMGTMNIGVTTTSTAIASSVPVSLDSAYALLTRVYVVLQIPVSNVDQKRAIGNDEIKASRHIAGMQMQKVVDCGQSLGQDNAETWDIHMNLLSYVQAGPNGTSQILTRIQAMGNPPDRSSRDVIPCSSTGELEKKIGDMVTKLASNK
jgi:hypothetical protein